MTILLGLSLAAIVFGLVEVYMFAEKYPKTFKGIGVALVVCAAIAFFYLVVCNGH
jgi:hypothetical protein